MSASPVLDAVVAVGALVLIAAAGVLVKAYFASKNPPKGKKK